MRTLRTPLIAAASFVLILGCCAAPAFAWRAVVAPKDTQELDLGKLEDAPGAFLVLPRPETSVELTLVPSPDGALELFLPERAPDRDFTDAELPTLAAPGATFAPEPEDVVEREPATGLRFRRIGRLEFAESIKGSVTVRVTSGSSPVRALVTPAGNLELDDPASTPSTVARMRNWYDRPADGSTPRAERSDSRMGLAAAILASVIVVAMVLLGAWWVLRGRAESRRRGVERFGDGD